jgi:hypothetical protein
MSSRRFARVLIAALALLGAEVTIPTVAAAQDLAAAEALFQEGRALLEKGDYATACAKLAESQRLDPSSGTLLNLATCHDKQGKTATAWAEFLAAGRLASAQGKPDRADEAKARAAEVAPNLSYLTVVVTAPAPGLEIRRDDVLLEGSSLGSKIPTDPGEHVLSVSAPGYQTLTMKVAIGASRDSQTVTIPALQKANGTAAVAPAPPAPAAATGKTNPEEASTPAVESNGRRTWGFILGGFGIAAAGVGTTFGVLALSANSDAKSLCPTHHGCLDPAISASDKANLRANIANVGVGVGIASIGVGAWLLLTGNSTKGETADHGLSVVPEIGPNQAGLAARGGF